MNVRIKLKNSAKKVMVSPEDAELAKLSWELHTSGYVICRKVVPVKSLKQPLLQVLSPQLAGPTVPCPTTTKTLSPKKRKRVAVYLHRLIMKPGKKQRVRFRDGNRLNCTRTNMFVVGKKR